MVVVPETQAVFISYSWDSDAHKAWVTRLADALDAEPDLKVAFDQYDLWGGVDLTHFMERGLGCDRIIVVCTPVYVARAAGRQGGVGAEYSVITAELANHQLIDKFIPVVRDGRERPLFLRSKTYVDFNEPRPFNIALQELFAALRQEPAAKRPPKRPRILESTAAVELSEAQSSSVAPPKANRRNRRVVTALSSPCQAFVEIRAVFKTSGPIWQRFAFQISNRSDAPITDAWLAVEVEHIAPLYIDFGEIAAGSASPVLSLADAFYMAPLEEREVVRQQVAHIAYDFHHTMDGTESSKLRRAVVVGYTGSDRVLRSGVHTLSFKKPLLGFGTARQEMYRPVLTKDD
jgi:hypothetical protein